MERLTKSISRLEQLQANTHVVGNSPAGILDETSHFLRDLPGLIDDLKEVQIDLEKQNDRCGNSDH